MAPLSTLRPFGGEKEGKGSNAPGEKLAQAQIAAHSPADIEGPALKVPRGAARFLYNPAQGALLKAGGYMGLLIFGDQKRGVFVAVGPFDCVEDARLHAAEREIPRAALHSSDFERVAFGIASLG